MMWGNGNGMWWMWLLMGGGTLAFWVVVVLVVRILLPTGRTSRDRGRPEPLISLKEGLARGEVSLEEYELRRRLIVDGH